MRTSNASGFTLVEVIIAMVLISILLAVAIPTLRGSQKTANFKQALGVGLTYDDAVKAFQSSHGGRAPVFGTADWPVAIRGPVSLGKPHLRGGVPEAVSNRTHGVLVAGSLAAGATDKHSVVVYQRTAGGPASATAYRITVYREGETQPACYLGDGVNLDGLSTIANPIKRCQ